MFQIEIKSPTESAFPIVQNDKPDFNLIFGHYLVKTSKFLISILSPKIKACIEEGKDSIIFENIKVNKTILQNFRNFINGNPLIIEEINYESLLLIALELEISLLLEKTFFFTEVIDIRNLLFSDNCQIPANVTADILASVFDLFMPFHPLLEKPPFFIKLILSSEKFVTSSEDTLCKWVMSYFRIHKDEPDSLLLFNYIKAENLSEEFAKNIIQDIDIHACMILMNRRLTFDPNDVTNENNQFRYKVRTIEELFSDFTQSFNLMPIYNE
ncbi:hypothetical protein TRFO_16499 [Tritrichomonas foetus]|uniref:BTB domain-containing protein n=1 Tax=Tritrichomonas foetus TaxID=1144522 RepID=A0A1J4KUR0_9EUKA|nr:hypothetical protein TRFO_16499 [Tritrichomonas foetus]|eukprot:OHT13398.1 hypothetical protein TRFO_16499 [Tritrichomonas foetus]